MSDKIKFVGTEALIRLIAQIKSSFASLVHKHKLEDIEDYVVDSTLSSTSTNPVQNKILNEQFATINDTLNSQAGLIANKIDNNALNNYYTKTEVDNLELITVEDIDTICGTTIQIANADEVEF